MKYACTLQTPSPPGIMYGEYVSGEMKIVGPIQIFLCIFVIHYRYVSTIFQIRYLLQKMFWHVEISPLIFDDAMVVCNVHFL